MMHTIAGTPQIKLLTAWLTAVIISIINYLSPVVIVYFFGNALYCCPVVS